MENETGSSSREAAEEEQRYEREMREPFSELQWGHSACYKCRMEGEGRDARRYQVRNRYRHSSMRITGPKVPWPLESGYWEYPRTIIFKCAYQTNVPKLL